MTTIYYIYGKTSDDGYESDPDAAIDRYYYYCQAASGDFIEAWDYRQNVVDKVKTGNVVAYTYLNGHVGAKCIVKVSPRGIEYLKTVANGDPADNISNLPEM